IVQFSRRGDRHSRTSFEWFRPINFSGFWVERIGRFRVPEDKLSCAAGFVNDRRTIPRLLGRQGAPEFFARVLVESHHGAAFAGGQANQSFPINQRVPSKTPRRSLRPKFLLEIVRPENFAVSCPETKQVPFRAQR